MPISTITANSVADNTLTTDQFASTAVHGRRNVLINGNFDIWQRTTDGTYTGGIWVYLAADRWGGHFDGPPTGAKHLRVTTAPAGSTYSLEVRGPSSGGNGNAYLDQRIESQNLNGIRANGAMTVSGWIRTEGNAGRVVTPSLITPTALDNFAGYTTLGGASGVTTISGDGSVSGTSMVLTSNGTWYYFTTTWTNVTSLTNFGNGLQLYFSFGGMSDTADKLQFSQLQLEAGTVATPFEFRGFGEELLLCQRFFEKSARYDYAPNATNQADLWGGAGTAGQTTTGEVYGGTVTYKVNKRIPPSITINDEAGNINKVSRMDYGVAARNNESLFINLQSDSQFGIGSGSGGTASGMKFGWKAEAEL